jgi:hypothetical protein
MNFKSFFVLCALFGFLGTHSYANLVNNLDRNEIESWGDTPGQMLIKINKSPSNKQRMVIEGTREDRTRLYETFLTSTAKEATVYPPNGGSYFASTPSGIFTIDEMKLVHSSGRWDVDMPYAMFFNKRGSSNRGVAIHATSRSHYNELGRRASGGCVRLHPVNAKRLYNAVKFFGPKNVRIWITK